MTGLGVLLSACLLGSSPPDTVVEPRMRVGAHIYGLLAVQEAIPQTAFSLSRARLSADFLPEPWLRGQLDADVRETPTLKDAWVELSPHRWLQVTAGQFKMPFSRIESVPAARLPLHDRGLVDKRLIRRFAYGGRDLGVMVAGRQSRTTWELAIHNGAQTGPETDNGKDVSTRVAWDLPARAALGVSGATRRVLFGPERARSRFAAGFDWRWRPGFLDWAGDVVWAEQPRPGRYASAGLLTYAVVRVPRLDAIGLRPLVKVEVLDEDLERQRDRAHVLGGGLNVHLGDRVRLMLQGENTWTQGRSLARRGWLAGAQLALDEELELRPTRP